MAKVVAGVTYDEDWYPINAMGERLGPQNTVLAGGGGSDLQTAQVGGGGGGGVDFSALDGLMSAGAPSQESGRDPMMRNVGTPSEANPNLGHRTPPLSGLSLAMRGFRNY